MRLALALAAVAVATVPVRAEELETSHLFGFTLGSDVNAVGETEGELENTGRFSKRAGAYMALASELGLKFIPFENFSIEPGLGVAYHGITGVPGLDDRAEWAFDTASLEMRYRLLDRHHAPVGLTIGADPHWGRVDDISGEPVDRYGADLVVILDRELIAERLFGAVNFTYGPEASRSRLTGLWEHQSEASVSGALSVQLYPGFLLGAEARFMRSYDGLGLDRFAGQALFVGPTFYVKFSEKVWMSGAWSAQVSGHSVSETGALDLVDFERHQAKLRFGYNF